MEHDYPFLYPSQLTVILIGPYITSPVDAALVCKNKISLNFYYPEINMFLKSIEK
jgi:hypothetical protein